MFFTLGTSASFYWNPVLLKSCTHLDSGHGKFDKFSPTANLVCSGKSGFHVCTMVSLSQVLRYKNTLCPVISWREWKWSPSYLLCSLNIQFSNGTTPPVLKSWFTDVKIGRASPEEKFLGKSVTELLKWLQSCVNLINLGGLFKHGFN